MDQRYLNVIICNNDLLVPDGTIDKLVEGLNAGWGWLLPVRMGRFNQRFYVHGRVIRFLSKKSAPASSTSLRPRASHPRFARTR